MATSEHKLALKVLVNRETKKVLFAEAGSDFVDVLYGFLTLPVGTIIRQLEKHLGKETCGLGCLNNLYASVRNLNSLCFPTEQCKLMLLYPTNASGSECQKLKLKIDDSVYAKFPRCQKFNGIFTAGAKSFMISEDLSVMPIVDILNFQVLQNLVNGVDLRATEEHILSVGLKEMMLLLKFSLISDSPLTNLFHALRGDDSKIINLEPVYKAHSHQFPKSVKTDGSIELKALVHKLTRKVLIVMAGDDFVELLFTILTIPLGSVVSLLGGSSSIGSIDNLYKSISDMSSDFLRSSSVKDSLINPKLPKHYLSTKTNKFLPVGEKPVTSDETLIDPKGGEGYIKWREVFMVSDDLVVSPLSCISLLSYLSAQNITCSDVEELVFQIGTNEALDILRASFTSRNSALSNALQSLVK